MLYELAIADAYGASFEFASKTFIARNNKMRYLRHPSRDHESILSGQYTDDTQMSIAIAELLLRSADDSELVLTQADFAAEFVRVFKRDKRKGYSRRIQGALEATSDPGKVYEPTNYKTTPLEAGQEFMTYLGNSSSTANGCVMRTLPIGFLSDIGLINRYCILHASVTHTSLEAMKATVMAAEAAHFLYHRRLHNSELKYVLGIPGIRRPAGPVPCRAKETIEAAVWLIDSHNDLAAILRDAISIGGDTDSVAAVAVGLGSLCHSIKNNLPLSLKRGLENTAYGKNYLKVLDKELIQKFPRSSDAKV